MRSTSCLIRTVLPLQSFEIFRWGYGGTAISRGALARCQISMLRTFSKLITHDSTTTSIDILIGHFRSLSCHSSPRTYIMNTMNLHSFVAFAVRSLIPQMIKPTQYLYPKSQEDLNWEMMMVQLTCWKSLEIL